MRNMKGIVLVSILLITLGFSFSSQACTPDGWSSSSMIPGNGETGSPLAISRYSELCAYSATDTSYVQSDHASDTRYFARVYGLFDTSGTGMVDVLEAYSDEGGASPLFKISYDGTNITFDAGDAGGGSASVLAANGWNLIEIEYDSDSSTFTYWLNEVWDFNTLMYGQSTGSFASGAGTVESVRLGVPNGMGGLTGDVTVDAFESHRTTNVGALIVADANGSGTVTAGDATRILNEVSLGGTLSTGQPDCNENGNITSGDATCVLNIIAL